MSIQGSINSLFNTTLGAATAWKLTKDKKKEEKAKVEGQYVTDLNKRILENKAAKQKEMDRIAKEEVAKAEKLEQQKANIAKAKKEDAFKRDLLGALSNISSGLQGLSMPQANQMMAEKGMQQIQQKNDVKQRFELAEQLSMFNTPKQTSLFDKKEGE